MNIKKHYQELFKKYGDSAESVQYSDKVTQFKRFEILNQVAPKLTSVIDVGCGLAHLYEFLESKNQQVKYLGLDFVNEFINVNSQKYKDKSNVTFQQYDITVDTFPSGYDYVLLSGVFNNKFNNNKEFMLSSISKMYNACNNAIAFNAMSTYVDYMENNLYYSDPLEVFDFCKSNLSKKVTLRHDYLVKENSIPFEYCIYVYK